jgi:hypothetical protein
MRADYTPELLSRAQAWLSLPLDEKRRVAGLEELAALYSAITGEPLSTCRQCQYSDRAALVVAYTREASTFLSPEPMSDSKYTLANGFENEVFSHEKYSKNVTLDTVTDEAAEFFIKHGYGHAFVLKPTADAGETEQPSDEKPSKTDLQARYKALFGEDAPKKHTIDKLTADINAKEAENALAQARTDYEAAHGEAPDQRLGVEKLTELTAAKLAEPQGSAE